MKSVSLELHYHPTTESYFDTALRFAPVKYVKKGVYEQLGSTTVRCRDFFSDLIVVDNLYPNIRRNVSIYKYKYEPTGYLKTSKKTRLALVFDKNNDKEETAEYIVNYLNSILPGNTIYKVKGTSTAFLLIGDPIWKKVPPMHSLYTLLINQAYQAYARRLREPTLQNIGGFLGNTTGHQWELVTSTKLGVDIVPLLINEFDTIFKSGATSIYHTITSMNAIHDNSGIYNLVFRALNIKKGKSQIERWWGGDWSKELAAYI